MQMTQIRFDNGCVFVLEKGESFFFTDQVITYIIFED